MLAAGVMSRLGGDGFASSGSIAPAQWRLSPSALRFSLSTLCPRGFKEPPGAELGCCGTQEGDVDG